MQSATNVLVASKTETEKCSLYTRTAAPQPAYIFAIGGALITILL